MAEWSIAAVLKTVELRGSGGSNPSLSATRKVFTEGCDLSQPFFIEVWALANEFALALLQCKAYIVQSGNARIELTYVFYFDDSIFQCYTPLLRTGGVLRPRPQDPPFALM